jgi:hypothetical protein
VITADTTLTADLDCSRFTPALTIGADGVTLDLGGHTLAGQDAGIDNPGFDDVTIRGGRVQALEFDAIGVRLRDGAQRNVLRDLLLESYDGIRLTDSADNVIRDVQTHASFAGIRLVRSDGNRIADSDLHGFDWGLRLIDSDGNDLVRSTTESSYESIQLQGSNDNRFADSTIGGNGILITGSGNVVARAAIADGDIVNPSVLLVGDGNVVRESTVAGMPAGTKPPAVEVRSGTGNVLRELELIDPWGPSRPFASDGILVAAAASDTRVVGNLVERYPGDGIQVDSPSTVLRYNAANDNGDLGIEAVPGVTGTGNTATGNGNPLQCVGITCS